MNFYWNWKLFEIPLKKQTHRISQLPENFTQKCFHQRADSLLDVILIHALQRLVENGQEPAKIMIFLKWLQN